MATCKNCGAKVDSKFCPYCGTKNEEVVQNNIIDTNTQNSNSSLNLDIYTKSLSGLFDVLKIDNQMKKEGRETLTNEELATFENVMQNSLDIVKLNEQSNLEFKEYKKKVREARRAIASGHCPECGANIKKNDDYCPKCGADCLMEAYDI